MRSSLALAKQSVRSPNLPNAESAVSRRSRDHNWFHASAWKVMVSSAIKAPLLRKDHDVVVPDEKGIKILEARVEGLRRR